MLLTLCHVRGGRIIHAKDVGFYRSFVPVGGLKSLPNLYRGTQRLRREELEGFHRTPEVVSPGSSRYFFSQP